MEKLGFTDYRLVWDFAHTGSDVYEEGVALLAELDIVEEHSFFISKSHDQSYWKTRKIAGAIISYHGHLKDCVFHLNNGALHLRNCTLHQFYCALHVEFS
jgi:hypothetical protein